MSLFSGARICCPVPFAQLHGVESDDSGKNPVASTGSMKAFKNRSRLFNEILERLTTALLVLTGHPRASLIFLQG